MKGYHRKMSVFSLKLFQLISWVLLCITSLRKKRIDKFVSWFGTNLGGNLQRGPSRKQIQEALSSHQFEWHKSPVRKVGKAVYLTSKLCTNIKICIILNNETSHSSEELENSERPAVQRESSLGVSQLPVYLSVPPVLEFSVLGPSGPQVWAHRVLFGFSVQSSFE